MLPRTLYASKGLATYRASRGGKQNRKPSCAMLTARAREDLVYAQALKRSKPLAASWARTRGEITDVHALFMHLRRVDLCGRWPALGWRDRDGELRCTKNRKVDLLETFANFLRE